MTPLPTILPKSRTTSDLSGLQKYYISYQTVAIKTSNFEELLKAADEIRKTYQTADLKQNSVQVVQGNVDIGFTEDSLEKMYLAAEDKALACVLKKEGELSTRVKSDQLVCAYFKDWSVTSGTSNSAADLESAPRSGRAAAPGLASGVPKGAVSDVTLDNQGRPVRKIQVVRLFSFRVKSTNYSDLFKEVTKRE